jgi:hypothetical protein
MLILHICDGTVCDSEESTEAMFKIKMVRLRIWPGYVGL